MQHYIVRFQISMDNSILISTFECVHNLRHDVVNFVLKKATSPFNKLIQINSITILHNDKIKPCSLLKLKHPHYVFVVKLCHCFYLVNEILFDVWVNIDHSAEMAFGTKSLLWMLLMITFESSSFYSRSYLLRDYVLTKHIQHLIRALTSICLNRSFHSLQIVF